MESSFEPFMNILQDGTIKQTNPLTGRKSWSIPFRANRPMVNLKRKESKPIIKKDLENYCNFCEANCFNTPPEKDRLVFENGAYTSKPKLLAGELSKSKAIFRRVENLFEIVTYQYWIKNYGYKISKSNIDWKERYIADDESRKHVMNIVNLKLGTMGRTKEEIESMPIEQKIQASEAFFGGSHELIIANKHYRPGAVNDDELLSSGELTPEEHHQYVLFTTKAIKDIMENNRYIRYVVVFQNWLRDAGASFDHLHKQIVGLDEWGVRLEQEVSGVRRNPHVYNQLVINYAQYTNRVVAENENAIAHVDIGHTYPTIAIFSKSENLRPSEHTAKEIYDFSCLIHAIHAVLGSHIACNEEWYYMPRDCIDRLPWHVLIKLRVNNPAGFEGGTSLHINPLSPYELRDILVPGLYKLRDAGRITNLRIAEECPCEPNPLKYINHR